MRAKKDIPGKRPEKEFPGTDRIRIARIETGKGVSENETRKGRYRRYYVIHQQKNKMDG
jgi:hypothetical protein